MTTVHDILAKLESMQIKPKHMVNDSRKTGRSDVFAAYPGEHSDGRHFIPQALAAGASAVLWEQQGFEWRSEWDVPNIAVPHLREQIGPVASAFYGNPSQHLWTIGITGTNGKTSCSHWLAHALTTLGRKAAIVGTLGNGFSGALSEAINTTPDPILLQSMLANYLKQGAQSVAMEVSSHGLAQGRVNGTHFDVAVLTNLTHDHLDYHGDMAAYAAAKQSLFSWPGLKCAVLNQDDDFGAKLAKQLSDQGIRVMTYGFGESDVQGSRIRMSQNELAMDVTISHGMAYLSAHVIGRFNAYNLLAVLTALLASGMGLQESVAALGKTQPVSGRMQQLGGNDQPLAVVDYAHTPDALEKVLVSLREQTHGRLICVFGCGGNRDKGKRPLMGMAASRHADWVVVTSDNPRHESPKHIIDDIVIDMTGDYHVEEDRAAAIDIALRQAQSGDVVLIAGKGHETYQEIGDTKLPFSDADVVTRVLAEMRGKS